MAKYTREFQVACSRLVAGKMSFAEFVKRTRQDWERSAKHLLSRWKTPASLDQEDVLQEMLLAIHLFSSQYDASHGVIPAHFLYWNAMDKGKKFIHKQRGCILHGNHDSNPSRFATNFSDLADDSGSDQHGPLRSRSAVSNKVEKAIQSQGESLSPLDLLEQKNFFDSLLSACDDVAEEVCLSLFTETGDAEEAAAKIYANPDLRRRFRLGSDEGAKKFVRNHLRAIQKSIESQHSNAA